MKKTLILIFTIFTYFVCTAQYSGRGMTNKEIELSNKKDSCVVFKEEVQEDDFVYCEINSEWKERRIIITTKVVKIATKSAFRLFPTQLISTKISKVYFAEGTKNKLLKTFVQKSYDNYVDDVLDDARLYVINELRNLKPSENIGKTRKEDIFKVKADTMVKQITITNNPEIELINENVENKSYSGSGNGGGSGGYSLGNRKALNKPVPNYNCKEEGKVVVQVTVGRNGKTISVISGIKGTSNTAKCLLDQARIAAMNTKWQASEDAPEQQVGKIVYNFSLN